MSSSLRTIITLASPFWFSTVNNNLVFLSRKGKKVIRSHIGSTQERGVVLKPKRFSHLLGQSFGLGSSIRLEAL